MGLIFRCTVGVIVSIALACALMAAVGTTPCVALVGEAAWRQAGGQHQGQESPVTGSIEGSVVDAETGQPLAYANIVLIGFQIGTMTGTDGSYLIQEVPPRSYTIMACMMGYEADTLCLVEVEEGKCLEISFELVPAERDTTPIIIDDSELLCEIHGVPIDLIWARIVGEPIAYDEAYERARRMIFPHADFEVYNACLSQTLDNMWAISVLGCPACVEARKTWLRYRQ